MPRTWHQRLDDMLAAIDDIQTIDLATLSQQPLMRLALERSFEILSEASRHLPADIKQRFGHIRWQDLADFGNLLRHGYHKVAVGRLIETARIDVPVLRSALEDLKVELGFDPR